MTTSLQNAPDELTAANETVKRLLESALVLFSEKGYEGASIREIIERAGVTRPVLYYYFENKEHLFCRLVETWFARMTAEMERTLAGVEGCRERLMAFIAQSFDLARRSPSVIRLLFQVFLSPTLEHLELDRDALWEPRFSLVTAIMQEGIDSSVLNGEDSETLAMAFCGLMDYHVMAHVNHPEQELSEELGRRLVDLFLNGAFANGRNSPVEGSRA